MTVSLKKYEKEKCIGCGACVEYCTRDVWRMDKKSKKAYIAYPDDCQSCYTCEINCPVSAIWIHPHRYAPHMWPCSYEYGQKSS